MFILLGGVLGNSSSAAAASAARCARPSPGTAICSGACRRSSTRPSTAPDGRWLYVSPGIESMLGYSVEEWMADPGLWFARMHPEDRDQALAAEERSHATGEPLYSEYRLIARDGRVVWFRDEASVVQNEAGRPDPAGRGDAGRHDAAARPGRAGAAATSCRRGSRRRPRCNEGMHGVLARGRRPVRLGRGRLLGGRRPRRRAAPERHVARRPRAGEPLRARQPRRCGSATGRAFPAARGPRGEPVVDRGPRAPTRTSRARGGRATSGLCTGVAFPAASGRRGPRRARVLLARAARPATPRCSPCCRR